MITIGLSQLIVSKSFINFKQFFSVGDEAIIFVSRSSSITSAVNPVPFNRVSVNYRQRWNTTSQSYTMNAAHGLLWIGLIAASKPGTPIGYILTKDAVETAGITVISKSHNEKLNTGLEFALKIHSTETLSVKSNYALSSDDVLQTGLTIFSLNVAMISPLIAFCVARDTSLSGPAAPIPFNVDVYNEELHYNRASHVFYAKSTGIYYFSFSVGV